MPKMPRGAIPTPRHLVESAPLHTIVGVTPTNKLYNPPALSMWGNATLGICVTAEEAFAKACYSPELFIPQAKIIKWAKKHYVANGAGLWEVLNLMQTVGIGHAGNTYLDGPFHFVDWTDPTVLQNAIALGPVKLGVAGDPLENVWQVTNGWFATGLQPGPQDHCVSLCGYGTIAWLANEFGVAVPLGMNPAQPGYALFTWSSIGIIDVPSLMAICGEAWVRSPTTIIRPDAAETE